MRAARKADGRRRGLYITDMYVRALFRRSLCRR